MYTALKLTTQEDLHIQPQNLLNHLETSLSNFETILKDLNCTPEDLHQTINDPQTNELLKLKAHLATLQLKLLAIRYIPHAFERLVHLMNTSEKPEVARRAATTVLNIAGIATNTKPEQPTPPTPQAQQQEEEMKPQDEPTPEDLKLLERLAILQHLEFAGMDIKNLPSEKIPDLIKFLTERTWEQNEVRSPNPD